MIGNCIRPAPDCFCAPSAGPSSFQLPGPSAPRDQSLGRVLGQGGFRAPALGSSRCGSFPEGVLPAVRLAGAPSVSTPTKCPSQAEGPGLLVQRGTGGGAPPSRPTSGQGRGSGGLLPPTGWGAGHRLCRLLPQLLRLPRRTPPGLNLRFSSWSPGADPTPQRTGRRAEGPRRVPALGSLLGAEPRWGWGLPRPLPALPRDRRLLLTPQGSPRRPRVLCLEDPLQLRLGLGGPPPQPRPRCRLRAAEL